MQIRGPQAPTTATAQPVRVSATTATDMVHGWRRGQRLQATVKLAAQNPSPQLEINGQLLQAKTDLTLQAGQRLQLEVSRASRQTVLKLLDGSTNSNVTNAHIRLPPPALSSAVWRSGQILQADIIQHPANPAAGKPSHVKIAGNILPLILPEQTIRTVPPGQHLRLEIIDAGQLAALRILHISSPTLSPALSPEQALRNALPRQLPLTEVLANLQVVSNAASSRSSGLPAEVQQQIQQLLTQLPQHTTVQQAEGLQQALARSGIFLEAQLSEALRAQQPFTQTAQALSGDLKGGLLGLLSLLLGLRTTPADTNASQQHALPGTTHKSGDTPPPLPNSQPFAQTRMPANAAELFNIDPKNMLQLVQRLLRQIDGGLARIQLSQLASSREDDDDGQRRWLLDLPLRHGEDIDVLQIRIDEERPRNNSRDETQWHVTLAFELEGLGAIHVRISLGGNANNSGGTQGTGKKVSAIFWAEENHTAELFKQHMTQLQQRLQHVGLNVGKLATHHGTPPPTERKAAQPYVLLDMKA